MKTRILESEIARWAALVLLFVVPSCHGAVIRHPLVPNHVDDFDFRRPPCMPEPAQHDSDSLQARYLGSGSVYLEWRGQGLLTAPFFSNPGLLRAAFGQLRSDQQAIARGLAGTPLDRVSALLVGHTHYDHLADLPHILREHLLRVPVLVNASGVRMLKPFCELAGRLENLDAHDGTWITFPGMDGEPTLRLLPIRSRHAPQHRWFHLAEGQVRSEWRTWHDKSWWAMKEGTPYAFLIEFLDDATRETPFRVWYQDTAGLPPNLPATIGRVDLAVLSVPSHWLATGYPETILERLAPRHVMGIHYEDFFRPTDRPVRFVANLSNRRMEAFLRKVQDRPADDTEIPDVKCGCGPCGPRWSVPLPGEWIALRRASAS